MKSTPSKSHPERLSSYETEAKSSGIAYPARTNYPVQRAENQPSRQQAVVQMIAVGDLPLLKSYGLDVGTWTAFYYKLQLLDTEDEVQEVLAILKSMESSQSFPRP